MPHDLIFMIDTGVMKGLSLFNKGTDDAIQPLYFLATDLEAMPVLRADFFILPSHAVNIKGQSNRLKSRAKVGLTSELSLGAEPKAYGMVDF